MRHIRLTLEYDGTDLAGWQRQANAATVQGHLEDALARLLTEPTRTAGASRTDAGVHARGQVASFHTDRTIPVDKIRRGLNGMLPPAVAVTEAAEAGEDWHPRFSSTGKHYRYMLLARPDRSPRWVRRAWHRAQPLDLAAMRAAGLALCGEHDFQAFRSSDCTAATAVRRLDAVTITPTEDESGLWFVDVRGNAFLRNMVRIIAGTLVAVGRGTIAAADLPEIIASKDRARAGQTAPPHGLELMSVSYDGSRPARAPRAGPPGPYTPDTAATPDETP